MLKQEYKFNYTPKFELTPKLLDDFKKSQFYWKIPTFSSKFLSLAGDDHSLTFEHSRTTKDSKRKKFNLSSPYYRGQLIEWDDPVGKRDWKENPNLKFIITLPQWLPRKLMNRLKATNLRKLAGISGKPLKVDMKNLRTVVLDPIHVQIRRTASHVNV